MKVLVLLKGDLIIYIYLVLIVTSEKNFNKKFWKCKAKQEGGDDRIVTSVALKLQQKSLSQLLIYLNNIGLSGLLKLKNFRFKRLVYDNIVQV